MNESILKFPQYLGYGILNPESRKSIGNKEIAAKGGDLGEGERRKLIRGRLPCREAVPWDHRGRPDQEVRRDHRAGVRVARVVRRARGLV